MVAVVNKVAAFEGLSLGVWVAGEQQWVDCMGFARFKGLVGNKLSGGLEATVDNGVLPTEYSWAAHMSLVVGNISLFCFGCFVDILPTFLCFLLFCCVRFSFKKISSGLEMGFVFASSSSRRVFVLFEALSMHFFSCRTDFIF